MIRLGSAICKDFNSSFEREWLETNGIGGYSSSSVAGANTRRYHGLLVAATRPPLGRMVLLSKFEETVIFGGERFEISCNGYPDTISPQGYKYLTGFRQDPFPIWTFNLGEIELERSVFMIYGENTTVCRWWLSKHSRGNGPSPLLELKPLLAFRDHHHLQHEDANFDGSYQEDGKTVSIAPYAEMPGLYFAHNALTVESQGYWYRDFEYAIEQERGFDHREDLFQPFSMRFDLSSGACVRASTEPSKKADVKAWEKTEIKRRADLVVRSESDDESIWPLVLAADQFIVARGSGRTVIAGYHWFSDWGRDTMIALNGLTLATNRPEVAKSILTEFSEYISEGMLPNRFPDADETPEYNTVDAMLWFFEAVRAYAEKTGDYRFVREVLYEKLADIVDWHIRGTRYNIHVDTDGLLYAGHPGVQLTWMDAKIDDWVVTPRTGKAVEIQALWYNALCVMTDLATRFLDVDKQPKYFEMAEIAKESFEGQFWNAAGQCLYDVIDGEDKDASVRPNQIFAVSLTHSMLERERARNVVKIVETELLTPFGLRSLSPNDPRYVLVYAGSPPERDAAYHQGTVWGWLIGPFIDAYRKVHSDDPRAQKRIQQMAAGLRSQLAEAMIGQVSEIFDGDPPHAPRGAPAQAWSVAELLRVITDMESR